MKGLRGGLTQVDVIFGGLPPAAWTAGAVVGWCATGAACGTQATDAGLPLLNADYLAERLEDPTLLERAVDIGEAAVPVGGKRRGGYACVEDEAAGKQVLALLALHEGFPNLRLVLSDDPEVMGNVRWGDEPPRSPPADATLVDWAAFQVLTGRYYGYSERAIEQFVAKMFGAATARAVLEGCSPESARPRATVGAARRRRRAKR